MAIDPRDGSVRAMVGGRDYGDSQFNRATQAMRQPGSTFKPIVYATAIHQGKSPATIIDDSPISLPQLDGTDWTPENYDLKFLGPMTMRRGLYESRNIIAIRVGMEVGENNVVEMAQKFGITTPIPPYPSIHIGSAEVHPLEIIGGYTTFANLGTRTTPNAILRVEDSEGNVLWRTKPDSVPVLSTRRGVAHGEHDEGRRTSRHGRSRLELRVPRPVGRQDRHDQRRRGRLVRRVHRQPRRRRLGRLRQAEEDHGRRAGRSTGVAGVFATS